MGSFLPKSAEFLFGTGGGGSVTVKDEGVVLGTNITSIDFIGGGVVAALTGPGQVTVGVGATPPSFGISSFTNNRNILEKGQSIGPTGTFPNISFGWSYSATPDTSQTINNGVGLVTPVSALSKLFVPVANITTDITYTLTAVNNAIGYNANTSIAFRSKRYWGVAAANDPVGSGVVDTTSLAGFLDIVNSEIATSRQTTKTFDCTGGRYFYFFFPVAFGTTSPQVQVGPFTSILTYVQTIVGFTNAFGHSEDYYVYRSTNLMNSNSVVVQVL
jgi:hypothetical protein